MKSAPNGRGPLVLISWVVGLVLMLVLSATTILTNAQAAGTATPSALIEIVPLLEASTEVPPPRTARAVFWARYEGLGTVVLPMRTCHDDLVAGVRIRVREVGASTWFLDERHTSSSYGCGPLRAFEFPIVAASRGRQYEVEAFGGSSVELLIRYHVLAASRDGGLLRHARFFAMRAAQYLSMVPTTEFVTILLLSAAAGVALRRLPVPEVEPEDGPAPHSDSAAVFLVTLLVAGSLAPIGVDPHHDGIVFKPALDVLSGQMLFRDTFSQYGALTTLLQVGVLAVAGPTLISLRLFTALAYAGTAVLMYLVFRKVVHRAVAVVLVAIWVFGFPSIAATMVPWSSVYALLFQMLALWLLLERKDLMGGAAASLCFWCRQPVGLFLAAAVLAAWMWLRLLGLLTTQDVRARSVRFMLGFVIACLPFLAWLTAGDALPDWWNQSFRFAARWASQVGGSSAPRQIVGILSNLLPSPAIHGQPTVAGVMSLWLLLPLATLIVLMKYSFARRSPTVILVCCVGLASWLQYHPVADVLHLSWAAPPMYGMVGLLLFQLTDGLPVRARVSVVIAVLLCLSLPEAVSRFRAGANRWQASNVRVTQPAVLAGLRLTAQEAEFHARFAQTLTRLAAEHPTANIITTGPDALYLTYSARAHNVDKMYVNWGGLSELVTPGFRTLLLAYVAERKPIVIVVPKEALVPPAYCRVGEWKREDPAFIYWPCVGTDPAQLGEPGATVTPSIRGTVSSTRRARVPAHP